MRDIQEIFENALKKIPQFALCRIIVEKAKISAIQLDISDIEQAVDKIISEELSEFSFGKKYNEFKIQINKEDYNCIKDEIDKFFNEKLPDFTINFVENTANILLNSLEAGWKNEFFAHQTDIVGFKERLEHRWGKALTKLRMLLSIVREWGQGSYELRRNACGGKLSNFDDVMLRLHVRACQVTNEIIILLENGYADGAMARWRTLHEIKVVAAMIAKFGDEIAERYVHYQTVESFKALEAYEKNHVELGYKPISKTKAAKIRKDYAKTIQRFGKSFSKKNGWAMYHLKIEKGSGCTFEQLENEVGDGMMHSPYKMASYNVHADPKGVYFKLGNIGKAPPLLAGASNAGLTEPARHTAVSISEITQLIIGDSVIIDDIVVAIIVKKLEVDIPKEFYKAEKKLRRDDYNYNKKLSS